ncbi:hypothetical protein [Roseateles paludis]|jgi:hypothetical protein|uniref:Uncharacterized protein n=1 Tax=Roseateles paludis TaxID=3145238 RepID=A0ABV0G5I2_9BURK
MPLNQTSRFGIFACALAALLALSPATSEASEVVKLARLIVTGKRSNPAPEPQRPATENRTGAEDQGHGGGSTDEHGTAPNPQRGVS